MKNLVTFSKQANGYIQFTVKPGYYATSALENQALYYVPNPIVGEEPPVMRWVEPDGMEKNIQFDETNHAESRVNVYEKKCVKAGCPPGWSVALVQDEVYGEYVCMEVKSVLFTRPLRVGDMQMDCITRFFQQNGMSIKEAERLFLKEMQVMLSRPMRMFDDLEMDEEVSQGREMCQELTMEEARYLSLTRKERVYCQQPFAFFGEKQFPVFHQGKIECVGVLRQNDTFQIVSVR